MPVRRVLWPARQHTSSGYRKGCAAAAAACGGGRQGPSPDLRVLAVLQVDSEQQAVGPLRPEDGGGENGGHRDDQAQSEVGVGASLPGIDRSIDTIPKLPWEGGTLEQFPLPGHCQAGVWKFGC